ncbi:MAG: hypothetical protein HFJ19_04660 [Clostridia bacterium]|nr:hypothetical protein [Clostridia bacterium]
MGIIKTKGIVLVESNMGDADKMVTLLTPGLRQNWVCSKRSKKTKKRSTCWHSIFMFCRLHTIRRK